MLYGVIIGEYTEHLVRGIYLKSGYDKSHCSYGSDWLSTLILEITDLLNQTFTTKLQCSVVGMSGHTHSGKGITFNELKK